MTKGSVEWKKLTTGGRRGEGGRAAEEEGALMLVEPVQGAEVKSRLSQRFPARSGELNLGRKVARGGHRPCGGKDVEGTLQQ
jgi:hypothetical protein